jgi:hypothetical protein
VVFPTANPLVGKPEGLGDISHHSMGLEPIHQCRRPLAPPPSLRMC